MLGGGVGGITAAFELTATPELRERFEVTVYQLGWRIGGKGASGRNADRCDRIEEHGLHIWFGFYDNAFRLMRDAYQELGREPGTPLATFDDAFKPCDRLVLFDRQGDGWHGFPFDIPPNFQRPGDPGELPTFWEMAATATRWALHGWQGIRDDRPGLGPGTAPPELTPSWFADLAREVASDLLDTPVRGADHLLDLAQRLAEARSRRTDLAAAPEAGQVWFLVKLLNGFRDWLWTFVVKDRVESDPDLRVYFTMLDVFAATVTGVVSNGVLEHGFDVINDQEWSQWLHRNGAKDVTIGRTPAERAPVLRAVYDVAFGYPEGDIAKADVAAGTATSDLLRLLFSYRGSLMYKMQAGMGDTVFTPFYDVLRRRGVEFRFFHAVTRLRLAADKPVVDAIDVVPQVELAVDEYCPIVEVKDLRSWPSEPRWEQLADGEALRKRGVNFELEPNPLGRPVVRLNRGTHFDQVVLGIPIGALREICGELTERDERFSRAVDTAVTVQTQAFQLWTNKTSAELGWKHGENSVAGCYVEPLDTYCDMTHLVGRESWSPGDEVRSIAYYCGVLPHVEGEKPADAAARARANAVEFLERDLGGLWPKAGPGGGSAGFDWSLLVDRDGRHGPDRFASQYWRANVTGSERYVLTTAGSVEHRLPSDDSGFDNLVLAGDWTKNGLDGGCVEAAVISAMQAARHLTQSGRPISGESPAWLRPPPQGLPPYIEYGGRATSPGPFLSLGGRLRGLLLEGDANRLREIVERTLNAPAGRGVDYRAVGSHVLLLIGGFERVSSMTPPFDRWGTVKEIQASFWVPVVAGEDRGDYFLAERFGLSIPYIFVDNPMSYLGGREMYGYAKTMGIFNPADGVGERTRLETFGGNFGRNEGAAWHPILEVSRVEGGNGRTHADPLEDFEALVRHVTGDLFEPRGDGEIVVPGVRFAETLVEDMMKGRMRQLFLKQFRDAADGCRACYQSVVEAPIEIQRISMRPSDYDWDVEIFPLDSHPIDHDIGVGSQRVSTVFDGELDMIVKDGIDIGTVAAPTAPATPPGARAPSIAHPEDGFRGLLTDAVGWLRREVSSIESRLRPW